MGHQPIEIRKWIEPFSVVLDWLGRETKAHMPENTWLKQVHNGEDVDENSTFHLMIGSGLEEEECKVGDWIARYEDGSLEVLPDERVTLLKQDGKIKHFIDPSPPTSQIGSEAQ